MFILQNINIDKFIDELNNLLILTNNTFADLHKITSTILEYTMNLENADELKNLVNNLSLYEIKLNENINNLDELSKIIKINNNIKEITNLFNTLEYNIKFNLT